MNWLNDWWLSLRQVRTRFDNPSHRNAVILLYNIFGIRHSNYHNRRTYIYLSMYNVPGDGLWYLPKLLWFNRTRSRIQLSVTASAIFSKQSVRMRNVRNWKTSDHFCYVCDTMGRHEVVAVQQRHRPEASAIMKQ